MVVTSDDGENSVIVVVVVLIMMVVMMVMFVLVGNKCDRTEDQTVPTHSGEEFAREHGLTFYESSAKENINTHKVTQVRLSLALQQEQIKN